MIRLSNKKDQETKVMYVEKQIPIEIEKIIHTEPQIQYIDREVIKKSEPETIIIEKPTPIIDLNWINSDLARHEERLIVLNHFCQMAQAELEMQRRALIGLKNQRTIDRNRRLMLIKRIKKEKKHHQNIMIGVKIIILINLFLTVCHFIIK